MGIERYVNILWMYSIGISLIFIGFYMIQFMSMGPQGFAVMMPGLLFCTLGGFYGKKKLLEGVQPGPPEGRQMDQIRQNVVSQLKLPGTEQTMPKSEGGEMADSGKQDIQPAKAVQAPKAMETQKPLQKPGVLEEKPSAEGLTKVMVCPGCDFENPPANTFCSNCGKRLRAKQKAMAKKPRKRSRS